MAKIQIESSLRDSVPAYVRCERSGEHSRGFHPGGKTHSQEWLCHVPSTSYWAKVFGVPLGLAWGKFRLSRTSGLIVPAYARCGRGEEHSGGFHPGGKTHSQEWLCHVPSTSCWAKVFGVPLGLVWGKFRLSRAWGTHCTCVCALDAVRNIQGASRWAEKAHSQEWLCHGQALEGGDQGWGLRASMNAKMVVRRASAASRPSRITVAMVSGSGVAKQPQLICMPAA